MSRLSALWKGPIGLVARVFLALLPLIFLFSRLSLSTLSSSFQRIGILAPCLSFFVGLVSILISSVRFRLLLLSLGANPQTCPSVQTCFRHLLIATYFALLPTGLVGDAARGLRIANSLPTPALAITAVFLDRVLGIVGLATVVLVSSLLGTPHYKTLTFTFTTITILGGIFLFTALAALPRFPTLNQRLRGLPVIHRLLPSFPPLGFARALLILLLLSTCTHVLAVLSVVLLLSTSYPNISFFAFSQVVPIIFLALFIPITPAGLGQRELLFSSILNPIGVAQVDALSASIVFSFFALITAFLGGFVLLLESGLSRPRFRP